jgi:hypothetical protein
MRPANDNARSSPLKLRHMPRGNLVFAAVATLIAALAIAVGLLVIDPPWIARQVRLDSDRSSDLNRIYYAVGRFHKDNGKLPASMTQLQQTPGSYIAAAMCDPATTAPCHYEAGEGRQFKLCATFSRAAKDNGRDQPFWDHAAGEQCFDLTAPGN